MAVEFIHGKPQNPLACINQPENVYSCKSTGRTYISKANTRIYSNDRRRVSRYLKWKHLENIIEGLTHAKRISAPLNTFVTINFDVGELPDHWPPQEAIGLFLKKAAQWLECRKAKVAYFWVREVGKPVESVNIGEHVHIAIHVPENLAEEFRTLAAGSWMEKAGMKPIVTESGDAIDIEPIPGLKGLIRYLCKGIDPNELVALDGENLKPIASQFKIEPRWQGSIYGRRCSVSQSINRKARDQFHAQRSAEAK